MPCVHRVGKWGEVSPFGEGVYATNREDDGMHRSNNSGSPFCFNVAFDFVDWWMEDAGLLEEEVECAKECRGDCDDASS